MTEAAVAEEKHAPSFICDVCGPEKPADQVWQCTLCLKYFCVTHIGPWTHDCYVNE